MSAEAIDKMKKNAVDKIKHNFLWTDIAKKHVDFFKMAIQKNSAQ